MASRGPPGGGESRATEPRGTPPFRADPAALAAILSGPGPGPGARPEARPGGAVRASLAGRVPLRLGSLRTQMRAPGAAARCCRRSAPRSPQASRPLQRHLDRASGFSVRAPGGPPRPLALPAAAPVLEPRGEAPKEAAGARSRSLKKHTDQDPSAVVKAETLPAALAPVLPSEQLSETGGATGGRPCLARRVPARVPSSARGTAGAARGAQGLPQTAGGAQAEPPGSLLTQESASMLPDRPSNESSTPGTDPPRASGPSNVGLARRVPITKAMRFEASKERFFRTPRLTPRSHVLGTHQRPLKWRLALSPQPGPSTDAAESKEEAPPWENIVVQLFREDEGQQEPEGQTPALPSTSPSSSTAQGRGAALRGGQGLAGCRSDGERGAGSAQGSACDPAAAAAVAGFAGPSWRDGGAQEPLGSCGPARPGPRIPPPGPLQAPGAAVTTSTPLGLGAAPVGTIVLLINSFVLHVAAGSLWVLGAPALLLPPWGPWVLPPGRQGCAVPPVMAMQCLHWGGGSGGAQGCGNISPWPPMGQAVA